MYPGPITAFSLSWLVITVSHYRASLVAQMVKNQPAMRETQVQSLCWDDPLEKRMVIYSSILAWRIPWTEEPGGLQSMGLQRVRHDWSDLTYSFTLTNSLTHSHSLAHTLLSRYYYLQGKKLRQREGKELFQSYTPMVQLWDSCLGKQSFMLTCKVHYRS